MSEGEVGEMVWRAKNAVTVPVDICPMNGKKTALDMAIKASSAGVDSLTMCMGRSKNYAALEDYVFTLMSVHDILPKEISLSAMCRAEMLHHLVFRSRAEDCITDMMRIIDHDIANLTNVDTGNRVKLHVSLKDKMMLRHTYVTALQKFAEEEDIPEDLMADMTDAINHFDFHQFDQEIMYDEKPKLLN